ncbi:unnamed protein product [Paramecium sonneborni]|uniref:Uncharacterized protein n=1 Tax=Paramecium sonneborni TaxID=65129 RepID=A0A8S1L327_9CILI|nr:unnamed protein product [Paramecium sonneborni]
MNKNLNIPSSSSNNPQQKLTKIQKIIQQVDQDKQEYFFELLNQTLMEILSNEVEYNLFEYINEDITIGQCWNFEFEGKKNFKGKTIGGVLIFQSDHPVRAPEFYFNPVESGGQVDRVIQHENIYGDHSLCHPIFLPYVWNKRKFDPFEILQKIQNRFDNPSTEDSVQNPMFFSKSEQEKKEIQQKQAQFLPDFFSMS